MNRNSIFTTVFALLALLAACNAARGQEFKTDTWLEDFTQLKREMSAHYANLEWAIDVRGLDLKQLSEQTESRLLQARNEAEAKKIIESFLDAFGDGHLSVQWAQNKVNNSSPADNAQPTSQPPLCRRLGYQSQSQASRIAFTRLNDFREINTEDSKYFSIGVLRVAAGRDVGVIRIAIFSEYAFPDLCEQAATEMKLSKDSPCDEECDERVERRAANLLTAALARQIEILKRNKISGLLVDITGNGGGTNWTEAAARTLSAKPLRSPRQQFIRHEHWTNQLKKRLEIIEADARQSASPNRELLLQGENVLRKAISESQKICDRGGVWQNRKPDCSLVADAPPLYPQSVLPYAKPGSLPDKPSSRFLFYPSRYSYREGVYSGQLMILADYGTWSSAEYFAAMLRDNNAATIIGEPTGGAGCGYTSGGIQTFLKNSRARVKIPDCVRLRADGSNEVAGITPDVLIPWRPNDSRYQRVKRVFDALLSEHLNRKAKR
ncbi:MAG: S41 family peptidase [Acidobacteriota bacterium]|nr:S41 family peptidase [Acidobacteriota bacterium]